MVGVAVLLTKIPIGASPVPLIGLGPVSKHWQTAAGEKFIS